ncbi:MAG: ferrous iron transport protein A [Lachnospiraceae bacterium]|nr:ferrous iron transport protein A [Lachnospiraceae bacterium]
MIPLNMADQGDDLIVRKVGGKPEVRQHLENLGFVVGSNIQLISELDGNVIVNVKESRIAISKEMAMKIYV